MYWERPLCSGNGLPLPPECRDEFEVVFKASVMGPLRGDCMALSVARLCSRVAAAHRPFPKGFSEEASLVFPPIRNDVTW